VEAVERFWISLADNVVLLVVVMPLVGAGLVRLMKPSGPEPVYFTGLVNVWLTAGMALIMVARFEPGQPDASEFSTRMTSSLSWMADWQQPLIDTSGQTEGSQVQPKAGPWRPVGPDVRLSVGVNRYSLWFLVVIAATTLAAFRSISPDDSRLVPKLSWLLLTESAMLGSFAAQDVILMAMCCQVSTLGLFFLIGQGGDPARREAARRFFRTQTVSGTLILFGLVGAAICHWWMLATVDPHTANLTFSLRRIVAAVPRLAFETEAAQDLWAVVSPWLFVSLCAGLLLRLPMPPFHHWWYRVSEHADSRVVAIMAVGYVPFSFYAAVRILVPLFPEHVAQIAPRLFLWGFLSAMFLSISAVAIESPRRKLIAAGMMSGCVAFGASMFGDTASIQGGLLLIVSSCGSLALLHLYWAAASDGTTRKNPPGSAADHWARRLTVLTALASLSVIPLSGSFWGEFMILQTIFRRDAAAAFWLIIAAVLLAISLRCCWHEFVPKIQSASDTDDGSLSGPASDTRIMPLMPIVFVLVAAALAPQWILGPPQTPDPAKADAAFSPGDSIQSVIDEPTKSLSLAKSAPNAE
jgi:NADH:ubiquinone oxidoreductase subunit 4 (subunit M)